MTQYIFYDQQHLGQKPCILLLPKYFLKAGRDYLAQLFDDPNFYAKQSFFQKKRKKKLVGKPLASPYFLIERDICNNRVN